MTETLQLPDEGDDAAELARRFREASPFPHLVLHDVLALPPSVAAAFPSDDWPSWVALTDDYERSKSACGDIHAIPDPFREIIREMSSPRVLRLLEVVTGIEKLVPDPHLEGGGLHCTGPGGHLAPHTDFHLHEGLGLYRRLNVLIFLNADWTPEQGGELVLGPVDDPSRQVVVEPRFGTLALFETDDRSVHGVRTVGEGARRQSIALYYYTSAPTHRFAGDQSTHWRTHGEGGVVHRARVWLYRMLMVGSRAFSMAAHLVNPHFGMRMVRERLAELRDRD